MSRWTPITAALAAAGCVAAASASAQAPAADICAGLASPAEEIACLRGALQESRAAREREVKAPAPAAPVARTAPSPARTADALGAEQVATVRREAGDAKPERARMQALATAVRTDHLGLVTLRLDNGQLWRQAEARGVPLSLRANRAYPVEISPSGFGGYRMNFTDMGRQIVVTRLE